MTWEVRACGDEDLRVLVERWPLPGAVHESHLADGTYLVAWDGADPLGSGVVRWAGCVGEHARAAHPGVPALLHLQVRDVHRGRGVGTALVRAAEREVRARGCAALALTVGADNPGASRLYTRLGFTRTGVLDTIAYTWLDETGAAHAEVETSELLLRRPGSPIAGAG